MAQHVVERPVTTTPCPAPTLCERYGAGHLLHPVHARMLGNRPWGWRGGTVRAVQPVDGGTVVVVGYTTDEGACRVWHHAEVDLPEGLIVRVHEQYHALELGGRLLNVRLLGGVGSVPEPLHRR